MKNLLITLFVLTAFCWSAFAIDLPRQDTTRKPQDTTKRHHPKKSGMPKKKNKKSRPKKDTLNRKPIDTVLRKHQIQ
jgi:hypothetical protein